MSLSSELIAVRQLRIERKLKQEAFQKELATLLPARTIDSDIESDDYKEDNAYFWITSIPQRARIWINGVDVGDLTPAKSTGYYLEPGTYTFELVLKNHRLWRETVTLLKGEYWSETISLEKRANLKINSDPERARIWLDGIRLSDLTPSKSSGYFVDPGTHIVKLEKTGYPTHKEIIDVAEGEKWNKTITLGMLGINLSNWDEVEPKLEDGTIGSQWWSLSESDRRQIATLAIANTEPNIAFGYIRTGKPNCEGGEGSWSSAQCGANAIVRYWKFGEDTPDGYHVYWSYDKIEEHCYVPEKPYSLPCFRVVAAMTDFGHEMAALQIGEDPSTLDSWRIFQYGEYNIKPGGWQMPYGCHIEISKYFGDIIAEFDI